MHFDQQDAAGTSIGACLAFGKSVYMQLGALGNITFIGLVETMILAAVGATVGFIVTAGLKFLKRKFSRDEKV